MYVWNARSDDDFGAFDYWLNIVNLLSDSSPTIVVQNKCDERTKEIDQQRIINHFGNVIGFYNVSAISGSGISVLKEKVFQEASNLPYFSQTLPSLWIKIRTYLEETQRPFMDYREYINICSRFGLSKKQSSWLSEYFHVLGVFLHFQENVILSETIFLKPEWATGATYKLFDNPTVVKNKGSFTLDLVRQVWYDYPREKHATLLELMKKFELCFQLPGRNNEFIIPSRLPASAPPDINISDKKELFFFYEYDFMPAGIIERAIVRLSSLIPSNGYWKNGALIKKGDSSALLTADRFAKKIKIALAGSAKAGLLSIIRHEIDVINASLNHPSVRERIPCNCADCVKTPDNSYYFDFSEVERARSKKKKTIECRRSFDPVDIQGLIGLIDGSIETKETEIFNLLKRIVDRFDDADSLHEKLMASNILSIKSQNSGIDIGNLINKTLILHHEQNK